MNPSPSTIPILPEEDRNLPTRIYQIERIIKATEGELRRLQQTHEDLIVRAIKIDILEDEICRILFLEKEPYVERKEI